jgi:hypothetical protein
VEEVEPGVDDGVVVEGVVEPDGGGVVFPVTVVAELVDCGVV